VTTTVSISLVRALVEQLERMGIAPSLFAERAALSLSELEDPARRIDLSSYDRAHLAALELSSDPALGLHLGEHAPLAAFNVVGPLTAHCRTLRECIEVALRYYPLVADVAAPELEEEGASVRIVYHYLRSEPVVSRLRAEFGLTRLLGIGKIFAGEAAVPREVWFDHADPGYAHEYARIFACPVHFDMPASAIVFARELLDRAQHHANPVLYRALLNEADRQLEQLRETRPMSSRVLAIISEWAQRGRPEMSHVARDLGLSERSLRRRLEQENAAFSELSERGALIRAARLLEDESRSIQDVADALGFVEVSSFHRAFKRWTGQTPRDYRRRHSQRE
jgi:AraC-like DNA-binding protein